MLRVILSRPSRVRRRKRAFTLIELLVVIAIIAILAAILFPVFAQAKAAAKGAATISNLKQNVLAVLMYSNDYDDTAFLPWQDGPYICSSGNTACIAQSGYAVQKLYPYTKNIQIAWDAASPMPTFVGGTPMGPGFWGNWTVSGSLAWSNNGLLYSPPNQPGNIPRVFSGLASPSQLMMLASCYDPGQGCFAFDSTQASCYNPVIPTDYNTYDPTQDAESVGWAAMHWHNNGYSSGFDDGHAKVQHGVEYTANDCNNETYQWWASNSSNGNFTPNNGWSAFYLSDPVIHYWGTWWDPTY